jgi:CheY-like chemotaxis protein
LGVIEVPMARVLVADDDEQFRSVMARMLELEGHEVLLAADGFEAGDLYRKHLPEVVVLDLYMPEKEGLETLLELRTHFPDIRIVVISGGGGPFKLDPLLTAKRMGAVATLTKPISRDDLVAALDEALKRE